MNPDRFLQDLSGRFAKPYMTAIHDLYVAKVRDNAPAALDARERLSEAMAATMGVAEVLGAMIALRAASRASDRSAAFRDDPQAILPRVSLEEALEDLVSRAPVTLRGAAERTGQRIAKLYSSQRVIAFARSAEVAVTAEAQSFITRALRDGLSEGRAGRGLSMAVDQVRKHTEAWSESYSRMVFRTNANTAVTAGRFRQARDQDLRTVVPAFRFDAVDDGDARDNHLAADGIILSVDNPAWNRIAPPLGYNCRCQVSHVTRFELEGLRRIDGNGDVIQNRIPHDAFPDPGFRHGGRPDLFLAGA